MDTRWIKRERDGKEERARRRTRGKRTGGENGREKSSRARVERKKILGLISKNSHTYLGSKESSVPEAAGSTLVPQEDGNLVIYAEDGKPVWAR